VLGMMNSPIITINPSKSISYVKETTQEKEFRRLSVVDNKAKILDI
jgi:predicted transcriptional regulator